MVAKDIEILANLMQKSSALQVSKSESKRRNSVLEKDHKHSMQETSKCHLF